MALYEQGYYNGAHAAVSPLSCLLLELQLLLLLLLLMMMIMMMLMVVISCC
jgi:hypothetical protein